MSGGEAAGGGPRGAAGLSGGGRRGLVALGDSITVAEGDAALGVPIRPWALWLAEALDLPFRSLAANGATTGDVLARQLPRVAGRWDVGCVHAGVNDVRSPAFSPEVFARDHRAVLDALAQCCDRLVVCTLPLDLGRPRAGAAKVEGANAAVRAGAAAVGAAVCELADLAGLRFVQPDAVHLTAPGELELARRAARALGAPEPRAEERRDLRARARFAATRVAPALVRDLARRAVERAR